MMELQAGAVAPLVYRGDGGMSVAIHGIEFWAIGRPGRTYRDVVDVTAKVTNFDPSNASQLRSIGSTVAEIAQARHADAVIPNGLSVDATGKGSITYRVVKYIDWQPSAGQEPEHDASVKDAEGVVVDNYALRQIKPSYVPLPANRIRHSGRAVVRVCVTPDGRLSPATALVLSSGFTDLDEVAVQDVALFRYTPASVHGRPIEWCSYLPFGSN
jgi:TonB family protein